jgi:hypothetical protein
MTGVAACTVVCAMGGVVVPEMGAGRLIGVRHVIRHRVSPSSEDTLPGYAMSVNPFTPARPERGRDLMSRLRLQYP